MTFWMALSFLGGFSQVGNCHFEDGVFGHRRERSPSCTLLSACPVMATTYDPSSRWRRTVASRIDPRDCPTHTRSPGSYLVSCALTASPVVLCILPNVLPFWSRRHHVGFPTRIGSVAYPAPPT